MIMHLLAIDISNTHIVLGVFRGQALAAHWTIATNPDRTADEYAVVINSLFAQRGLAVKDVTGSVIANVVPPLLPTFLDVCRRYLNVTPLVVGPGIKTGIRIRTDNPREVGADRIANALAAQRLYGRPAIVVDFATATTFDAISAEGDYLGAAIAPGVSIAAEALFRQAARLYRVELTPPPRAIGKSTVESMQSGLIFGYVGLVEGMVDRLQQELGGKAHVIATGEQAHLIARLTRVIQVVDVELTLIGLRMIYELNSKPASALSPREGAGGEG